MNKKRRLKVRACTDQDALPVAIIWRESVYRSGRCPKCGEYVYYPWNNDVKAVHMEFPEGTPSFCCDSCGTIVAYLRQIPESMKNLPGGRYGKWPGEENENGVID